MQNGVIRISVVLGSRQPMQLQRLSLVNIDAEFAQSGLPPSRPQHPVAPTALVLPFLLQPPANNGKQIL